MLKWLLTYVPKQKDSINYGHAHYRKSIRNYGKGVSNFSKRSNWSVRRLGFRRWAAAKVRRSTRTNSHGSLTAESPLTLPYLSSSLTHAHVSLLSKCQIRMFVHWSQEVGGQLRPYSAITGVCPRCKEQIDWKRRYGKYKPLSEPAKWYFCFFFFYFRRYKFLFVEFWFGNHLQPAVFQEECSASLSQSLCWFVFVQFVKLSCFMFVVISDMIVAELYV